MFGSVYKSTGTLGPFESLNLLCIEDINIHTVYRQVVKAEHTSYLRRVSGSIHDFP